MSLYHRHFELRRSPFSIAPDPHFLYMSERHREALAHLEWGLSGEGGFVLLTGEVGTGKTTLCRCLLERIPDDTEVAFVINPRVTATELLTTICEELGDAPPEGDQQSVKRLVDRINEHLLAAHGRGGRVVLVIDEAQNLSVDVLEQVRLLTNLETSERKLLQVILLGQPELATMLEAPELRQLAQRVTARYHLLPLSATELGALVHHRLAVAGARRNPFDAGALAALHRRSGGIPRVANVIADRALLGAYAEGAEEIDARIVRRAAREVLGEDEARPRSRARGVGIIVLIILVGLALGFGLAALLGSPGAPGMGLTGTQLVPERPGTREQPSAELAAPQPAPAAREASASAPTESGPAPEPASPTETEDAARVEPTEERASSRAAPATDALASLWERPPAATRLEAVRALLEAWYAPIPLTPETDPCAQVAAAGLRCLEAQGSWPGLLELDRPAVLELWRGRDREPRHLALLGSTAGSVTVQLGGERLRLPRETIDRDWRGRALVLWQMPPGYARPSRRSDDDATSAWLADRLALLDGATPGADGGAFDAALEARVRRFQLDAGLRPDGIVGPRTWMRLNDATGVGVPRLRTP
ncbi:MAG: AAA family ATPase [Pseudomonadales bacterium]|jgi:general secretion pathway protein A|nr:AAA family ATPase [Pseudomonadales bacterium]